jgi:DNA-binding transcriptional LysR family regulator
VTLTESGRVFLVEAHRVLNAAAEARDAVTDVQNLAHATLSIGTGQYVGGLNLPELLARFHAAHPDVEIRLRQGGAGLLAEEVLEGRLDLAIAALPHTLRSDLVATPIGTVPMLLACSPDHRLARRRLIDVEALSGEKFVDFPAGWAARTAVDRSFEELNIERQVAFEVNDIIGLLNLVAHNLGIAIVPGGFASIPAAVSYARLRAPAPVLRYAAIRRKNERLSHAARVFLAMALPASSRPATRDSTPDDW